MTHSTHYARCVVRVWLIAARWTEKRLRAAYDHLAYMESGRRSPWQT